MTPLEIPYFYSMFRESNISLKVFYDNGISLNSDSYYLYYEKPDQIKSVRTNYVPITIRDSRNGEFYFGVLYLQSFII